MSEKTRTTIALLCNALAPFASLGKPSSMDGWASDTERVSRADCIAAYQVLALVKKQTCDDAASETPANVSEETVQDSKNE